MAESGTHLRVSIEAAEQSNNFANIYQEMEVTEDTPSSVPESSVNLETRLAEAVLVCQTCKKFTTYSYKLFKSHIRKHTTAGDLSENVSEKKFIRLGRVRRKALVSCRKKKFRVHGSSVTSSPWPYNAPNSKSTDVKCPHCSFTADRLSNLSIHVKRKHTNLAQPKKYKCSNCSFSVTSRKAFQEHLIKQNHFDRKCQICAEVFEGISEYLDHISLHFSGISVSPKNGESNVKTIRSLSEGNKNIGLHEALKEAMCLEAQLASSASTSGGVSFTRGEEKHKRLEDTTEMELQVGESTSLPTRSANLPDSSTSPEDCMNVDSTPCEVATQTADVESTTVAVENGWSQISPAKSSTNTSIKVELKNAESTTASLMSSQSASPVDDEKAEAPGSNHSKSKLYEEEKCSLESNGKSPKKQQLVEYTCVHCDITFRDRLLFTVHRGSHGFKNPFSCNLCGVEMKDKYEFAAHFHCS